MTAKPTRQEMLYAAEVFIKAALAARDKDAMFKTVQGIGNWLHEREGTDDAASYAWDFKGKTLVCIDEDTDEVAELSDAPPTLIKALRLMRRAS